LTQFAGTLFAVYGVFMNAIGWQLAGFIWAYALVFFVVNDFTKVRFYELVNHSGIRFAR